MKHRAALLALLVLVAGCGGNEGGASESVYKVVVKIEDVPPEHGAHLSFFKESRRVEWVEPASGRWRIETRSRAEPGSSDIDRTTTIYTGSACFEDASYSSPSIRVGSRRFLGPCVDDSVALEPLQRQAKSGRERPEHLRVERGGFEFVATVVETISRAEAEERGLFEIPAGGVPDVAREVTPGKPPALRIKAYWFGPKLGSRDAVVAVEHRIGGETTYTTFYVPPGESSNAYPGAGAYSDNEVQVVCKPLDDPIAKKNLGRVRRREGTKITLSNGERATLFREGGAFSVVTETTLVSVAGAVLPDIAAVTAQLRPL